MGTATATKTSRIYQKARERMGENGRAWIEPKEVAQLLRQRLKAEFPGVKFSIRTKVSTGVAAINIDWAMGPPTQAVEEIAAAYSFGGFDGSIDLQYSGDNWLHPDGTMSHAASPGTDGSMGSVPGFATDCPEPGAILVKGGPEYVHTHRMHGHDFEDSERNVERVARAICRREGIEIPAGGVQQAWLGNGFSAVCAAHCVLSTCWLTGKPIGVRMTDRGPSGHPADCYEVVCNPLA